MTINFGKSPIVNAQNMSRQDNNSLPNLIQSTLNGEIIPMEQATVSPSGDSRIAPLLAGYQWGVTTISYSFYSGGSFYGTEAGLAPVSEAIKANVRNFLANVIEPLINVNFVEVSDSPSSYGLIRYFLSTTPSYAYTYYPFSTDTNQGNNNDLAGDVFLNSSYDNALDTNGFQGGPGTHGYTTLIHETLHALGLKHPGDYNGNGTGTGPFLPFADDNLDNTVMSYNFAGNEPGTPMPYDLLALQYMYGAKPLNSGNTTYTFSSVFGYSDGMVTVGNSNANNPTKLTIWDSGGIDTLDFSGLGANSGGYRFDLNPGGWLTTQSAFNGTTYQARGDISGTNYSVTTFGTRLTYGVDIEKAIGTSSNDTFYGNSLDNYFSGGFGNDVFYGGAGNDVAIYAGTLSQYQITGTSTAGVFTITDSVANHDGTDTLNSIESLEFSDQTITLTDINLFINDVTIIEGNSGTTNAIFTVTHSGTASQPITVNYATANGTATAGSDFTNTTGTLTFAINETTKTISVPILGDTTIENDETFFVNLSNATNATIVDAQGLGTIRNDEVSITLAVSPASVTEDGTTNIVYTFTRTGLTTNALTVNYTVGGTATFNTDYTQIGAASFTSTKGTVAFAANSSTAIVTVDPKGDTAIESNETVALTLGTGTGYTLGTTTAVTGTILNDDTNVTLAVSPASVTEDDTTNIVYTFTRTGLTTNTLTVNYTVGGTATFNTDYTQIGAASFTGTIGTVTFAANSTTAKVTIDPTADTIVESNETVALTLALGTGYTVGTTTAVTGTITNDDVNSSVTTTLSSQFSSLTLTGNSNINGTGNSQNNIIIGNNGNNQLNGAGGADTLTGGAGIDTFIFQFGQSTITASDLITDFTIGTDKIDLLTQTGKAMSAPIQFTRAADSAATDLSTLATQVFTDADGLTNGNQALGINSAALVNVTSGVIAGTYLFVNDSTAGLQTNNDLLINLTGYTGTLPALGNIAVGNFFV